MGSTHEHTARRAGGAPETSNVAWLAHPDYTDAQATAVAQKEFETAALNFFLETLKVCQEVRPNARWGAYGVICHLCVL